MSQDALQPSLGSSTDVVGEEPSLTHRLPLAGNLPITVEVKKFFNDPQSADIEQISELTRVAMTEMNHAFPGLPPDSIETTRTLVTRPGAHTVILRELVPAEQIREPRILGYGIIITGVENFPDADHIPPYLLTNPDASRVIRLFVTPDLRRMLPDGEAFTVLLEQVQEIGGKGPIIGMILTDIHLLNSSASSEQSMAIWLEARRALAQRGFDDTGQKIIEHVSHADGKKVDVNFEWWVYPPDSETARQKEQEFKQRSADLKWMKTYGLSCVATAIPAEDAVLVVHGSQRAAYDVARLSPRNVVLAGARVVEDQQKAELLPNLLFQSPETMRETVATNSGADAVLMLGILPDVARQAKGDVRSAVADFIDQQTRHLKSGKELVIRDTIAPKSDDLVIARMSASEAEKFERFIKSDHEKHIPADEWGRVLKLASAAGEGRTEFLVPSRLLKEFFLKSLYERDWPRERNRTYTLFSAEERRELIAQAGLRLLYAGPEYNSLLLEHYRRNYSVTDMQRQAMDSPITNYTTIAEKVDANQGVRMLHTGSVVLTNPRFVQVRGYVERDTVSGEVVGVRELASRKNVTHDVIGYQVTGDKLFVRSRIFPRPLLTTHDHHLDGSFLGGYVPEQIASIVSPSVFDTAETINKSAHDILINRSGLAEKDVGTYGDVHHYYPFPDLVDEEVFAQAVRISGDLHDVCLTDANAEFSPSVTVRMCDAERFLHGCQVGGIQDARIERVIYDLMRENNIGRGEWLGQSISLDAQQAPLEKTVRSFDDVRATPSSSRFEVYSGKPFGFFETRQETFQELDKNDLILGQTTRESVVPRALSYNSASLLPVVRVRDENGTEDILVGIEVKSLPKSNSPDESITLPSVPLFLMKRSIDSIELAQSDARFRFEEYFGCAVRAIWNLGSKYAASPGLTPAIIYPMVAEVDAESVDWKRNDLQWVKLRDLETHIGDIKCGQLITAINRLSHALKPND